MGWDGKRAFLANRQFPRVSAYLGEMCRRDLPKAFDQSYYLGDALGYYANMEVIGRGTYALRWLRRNMSASNWEQFEELLPEASHRLKHIHRLFWAEDKAYYATDEGV